MGRDMGHGTGSPPTRAWRVAYHEAAKAVARIHFGATPVGEISSDDTAVTLENWHLDSDDSRAAWHYVLVKMSGWRAEARALYLPSSECAMLRHAKAYQDAQKAIRWLAQKRHATDEQAAWLALPARGRGLSQRAVAPDREHCASRARARAASGGRDRRSSAGERLDGPGVGQSGGLSARDASSTVLASATNLNKLPPDSEAKPYQTHRKCIIKARYPCLFIEKVAGTALVTVLSRL